ncbi:ABC transporter ATP-binding protein [Aquitalea aquatica]|uniref:ABC transporter ATP-binding protein n=1 Tax=Aquitalea aquatica TaxID=3044273 RepID=A0A838Y0G8_9NEIS|nr:ABC transporter ATP-binding protein [Aquitalea magnusonii]MBA4707388.1 ABC transporter ATP-binding protein [Aquitalea magnusonii]
MIRFENLCKSYKTPAGRHYLFRQVNLEIPSGKSIALLGRNGAGKSTLLRLIGGMDRPDCGRIHSDKTISWPVGLSTGFQGSMSGRENVKFVARLYAKPHELAAKVGFVEEFAELGRYFDMPLKSYSSGMRSRLGFGLSMAFDFDYYLLDEITSVGDAVFRQKSAALIQQRRQHSQFIFVSHNIQQLRQFCDVALLLDSQGLRYFDDIDLGIAQYRAENHV